MKNELQTPIPVFLFRSSRHEAYSIEEIFRALNAHLHDDPNSGELEVPFPSDSVWNIIRNIRFARKLNNEFIHVTGDIHYVVPFLRAKKVVLTIHDAVILSRYSKWHPKYWLFKWLWYSLPVRFADAITVISEKTRDEVIRLTGVSLAKVHLIPNFVKPIFLPENARFNADSPLVLLVGGGPHKNISRSIEAISTVPNGRLLLLGTFEPAIFQWLENREIPFEHHQNLKHQEVADLYRKCDIVLFPSLYEGFGMPIIEGQASGRPVITSHLSPMKEVAGKGACLVDPTDTDSIKNALQKVVDDPIFRQQLIEKGLENVQRFQLSAIAQKYLAMYASLGKIEKAVLTTSANIMLATFGLPVFEY